MRYKALAAAALTALALAGCSTTTSVDDDTTATATTTTSPSESEEQTPPSVDEATPSATEVSTTTPQAPAPAPPAPRDRQAQEVESVPSFGRDRSEQDVHFLQSLKDGDIDVDGVEDQLIGAAAEVCRSAAAGTDNYTLAAVAGQLVEQSRTANDPEVVAATIDAAARDAYCATP